MISNDTVTKYILAVSRFVNKRGEDSDSRRALVDAIDELTGTEGMLDAIYVNLTDNFQIPDVSVIHLYDPAFSMYLLDPDTDNTCPFGYTIEISGRCFSKYSDVEIAALILHDILQNVMSDTAKIRFLKAYTDVISAHHMTRIISMFDNISLSEVCYIAFMEICCRPFRVPVQDTDYVAVDDVLRTANLADAYDSYLNKALESPNTAQENAERLSPEEVIDRELRNDHRDVRTIIDVCLDRDIRHYYTMLRNGVPLISLENVLGSRQSMNSIGFVSRKRKFKHNHPVEQMDNSRPMSESYNDPKTEVEIRFSIDRIINSLRYAETESDREILLFKVKQLELKLYKKKEKLEKGGALEQAAKYQKFITELEGLRESIMAAEIKQKKWGVYIKDSMPEGYRY